MSAKILVPSLLLTLLASCDNIGEDERLIEVAPGSTAQPADTTVVLKNVLLEDYTGQRCINCPRGAEVIAQLQEALPAQFIAVGVYSGPFGKNALGTTLLPLTTADGCEYYDYWKVESQPGGQVNRNGNIHYNVFDWTARVMEQLNQPACVKMELTATLSDEQQIDIALQEEGINGTVEGKLQVWVVEDGIVAIQLMPDGSSNRDYVHNHVLRTAVNGTWGTDFTIAAGEHREQTYVQPLKDEWNVDNLSIVAFVYGVGGVEQVVKAKVNQQQYK